MTEPTTQPEALLLAMTMEQDAYVDKMLYRIPAELRRQHAEIEAMRKANLDCVDHYNDARAEIERLKLLSVTNIMLDVVPEWDGMGLEVFAKSIADVEAVLAKQGERIENLEGERDTLAADNARLRAVLADIAATEPVAHVSSVESNSPLMCGLDEWHRKGLIEIFTRPMPAQVIGLTEKVEASGDQK